MRNNKLTGEEWTLAKIKRIYGRSVDVVKGKNADKIYCGYATLLDYSDSDVPPWKNWEKGIKPMVWTYNGEMITIDKPSQVVFIGEIAGPFNGWG